MSEIVSLRASLLADQDIRRVYASSIRAETPELEGIADFGLAITAHLIHSYTSELQQTYSRTPTQEELEAVVLPFVLWLSLLDDTTSNRQVTQIFGENFTNGKGFLERMRRLGSDYDGGVPREVTPEDWQMALNLDSAMTDYAVQNGTIPKQTREIELVAGVGCPLAKMKDPESGVRLHTVSKIAIRESLDENSPYFGWGYYGVSRLAIATLMRWEDHWDMSTWSEMDHRYYSRGFLNWEVPAPA